MKNGLTDEQKKELRFIRHLVTEVKEFDLGKYKNLIEEYKKEDPDISQILSLGKIRADERYNSFLNSKILKHSSMRSLDVDFSVLEESSVLSKVTGFLQKSRFNENEYRISFLNKALVETTLERDQILRENYRAFEKAKGISIEKPTYGLSR